MLNFLFFIFFLFLNSPAWAQSEPKLDSPLENRQWNWSGQIQLKNDFEKIESQASRDYLSLDLKFKFSKKIEDHLSATLQFGIGKGQRQVNQTFGSNNVPGMVRRNYGLDLAYMHWTPLSPPMDSPSSAAEVTFDLGRMPQNFFFSEGQEVLLDSGLSLEGLQLLARFFWNENIKLEMKAGSHWLRENYDSYYSEDQTDNMLNWGQLQIVAQESTESIEVSYGFFNFVGIQGHSFSEFTSNIGAHGNSESSAGVIQWPFLIRHQRLQITSQRWPQTVSLGIEAFQNNEAPTKNEALSLVFILKSKDQDLWNWLFSYVQIQADAVPSVFTGINFSKGNTDVRGYIIKGEQKIAPNIFIQESYFGSFTQVSQDSQRYDLLQIGLKFLF